LAAQPLVRYSYLEPKETYDTNFNGSLNILEIVRKLKTVKASIIITTDKVYDNKKNKIFKETDLLGGYDPYSNSKVCVEFLFDTYLHSFFEKQTQKKLVTVRAGNVIGGGDYSEDRLIPDIFRFYKKQKDIILRNPESTRPWQHVLEPLGGYLLLAEKLYLNKLKNNYYSWNFGPNLSSCVSVSYIAKYFAKRLKMKIKYLKESKNVFRPETSLLRLSNYKAS
jgi:CDP-glucose 4,6-dehydratase